MSDCCSKTNSKTSLACPQCSTDCKQVTLRTLYHQVRFPENQQLASESYYFCPLSTCSIAYFSSTGQHIAKSHLITQQAMQDDTLCYCFDITSACYQSALQSDNADSIKDFVIQRTKLAECACEIRNPSGLCCLARFKQLEKNHIPG
jgi:hypothetical protein